MHDDRICPLLSAGTLADTEVTNASAHCLHKKCAWWLDALDMCAIGALADTLFGIFQHGIRRDCHE